MSGPLRAPFPWFGGKSRIAPVVWHALGNPPNYVEPFFGSGAVFLQRPHPHKIATINDADGFVANFWRAVRADPEAVAEWADSPVSECDLHARHLWLLDRKAGLPERLMADPDYFDAKVAGWWCWGLCCWIGGGWCSGKGPWRNIDGVLNKAGTAGQGVHRRRPHLGNAGQGVQRQLPDGRTRRAWLTDWFSALADALAVARVCCGDWSRVCGPAVTVNNGLSGVFLDPPYSDAQRAAELYTVDSRSVAHDVRAWCLEQGQHPQLRIVLAGYEGEHDVLEAHGWRVHAWSTQGGYANNGSARKGNKHRERMWFSPHCLPVEPKQRCWLGGVA